MRHRDRARLPNRLLTVEEYLDFEERSELRHEFVGGRVYAMSGVRLVHERVLQNLMGLLRPRLRRGRCELFSQSVKLRTPNDAFYYPDVMVRCGARLADDVLWVTDPCLLVEVTSPSTRANDRREKRTAYTELAALRTYLVVAHTHRSVERWWRDGRDVWQFEEVAGRGEVAIDGPTPVSLTLDAIYAGTDVPERRLRRLRERAVAAYAPRAQPQHVEDDA